MSAYLLVGAASHPPVMIWRDSNGMVRKKAPGVGEAHATIVEKSIHSVLRELLQPKALFQTQNLSKYKKQSVTR